MPNSQLIKVINSCSGVYNVSLFFAYHVKTKEDLQLLHIYLDYLGFYQALDQSLDACV